MRISKLIVTALVVTGLAAATVPTLAAQGDMGRGSQSGANTLTPLTEAEVATLKWMREEEKLARDMYLTLNLYHPAKIFTNIAASEQRHFDALGKKLELYGVEDPAQADIGVFTDPGLQALYDQLIAQGLTSQTEAYKVGVLIEETDIADLTRAMNSTTDTSILATLDKLRSASESHLAAFSKKL